MHQIFVRLIIFISCMAKIETYLCIHTGIYLHYPTQSYQKHFLQKTSDLAAVREIKLNESYKRKNNLKSTYTAKRFSALAVSPVAEEEKNQIRSVDMTQIELIFFPCRSFR